MTLFIAILAAVIVGGIIFIVYQLRRPYMVFPNSPMNETTRTRAQVNADLSLPVYANDIAESNRMIDDATATGFLSEDERRYVEGESNWLDYVEKMSR